MDEKKCVPCSQGQPCLQGEELKTKIEELGGDWKVVEERYLEKDYRFKNFAKALEFVVILGQVAEEAGHHPDIFLEWGHVRLRWWTHKAGGLTESDFVLADRSDAAFVGHFG